MDEVYLGFRKQAFSIKVEDLNVSLENSEQVFATIVDIPINGKLITLFCMINGTISMYYSNGKFDIGLGEKEAVRKAAISLLISSGQCLPFMDLYEDNKIDESVMQVFMFYRDGIKTKKIDIAHMKTKEEKFMNFLIQNVLTAIRSHLDKGEFTVKEIMCLSCKFNNLGPLKCEQYPDRKPSDVLKGNPTCPMHGLIDNVAMAGIIGAAVGDALGVPVEFCTREQLMKNPVTDMRGNGTHNQPVGTWSDDTSLILALIAGLREKEYSVESIAEKFVKWYDKGLYTPNGDVFDIGNSTLQAINRIKQGISARNSGGNSETDNGNGSLMRILPLAYYLKDEQDIEKKVLKIYEVSAITHKHIRSKVACHIYVEIAIQIISGKNIKEAYYDTCKVLKKYYADILDANEKAIFQDIFDGKIEGKKVEEISSSGYVIDTLSASLWCLLNTDNYKSAVLRAVNLGGDTDTTGVVTGGLAGLSYGLESIPKNWIESLVNRYSIFNAAQYLYNKCFSPQ